MKTRAFFVGALLFAMVLAPSALRASARPLGASSCQLPKTQLHNRSFKAQRGHTSGVLLASLPGHHRPAPRLHRIRGKKIGIQRIFALTPRSDARANFLFSFASVIQQDLDGPNPSRGPPSQFTL